MAPVVTPEAKRAASWFVIEATLCAEISVADTFVLSQFGRCAPQGDRPCLHDVAIIGRIEDEVDVLLDQQNRHLLALLNGFHYRENRLHDHGRQTERRLVKHEKPRLGDERARDRKHLLLASRQRSRSLVKAFLQFREVTEDSIHLSGENRPPRQPMGAEPQVFIHRQIVERPSSLGNMGNSSLCDLFRGEAVDAIAVETDPALRLHHA